MNRANMKATAALALATMGIAFAPAAPANATVTALTDCKFGVNQVFDVQWNPPIELGKALEISSVTFPYGNAISPSQLNSSNWSGGDYVQFVESTTDPGTFGLEMFDSAGNSQGMLDTTGTFAGLGEDFIFYLGGGSWGTVITTGQGFAYGASASLSVTDADPTYAEALAYTNCVDVPLGEGQSREDVTDGDGDSETETGVLALNLKLKTGQLLAGKDVEYSGEGLQPNSDYTLYLHSTPVLLGEGVADDEGTFTDTIQLPEGIEPGPHRIILTGIDPDGNTLTRTVWIYVSDTGRLLAKSTRGPISESDLLAMTGFETIPVALGGFAVLAVGVGVALWGRRRRA